MLSLLAIILQDARVHETLSSLALVSRAHDVVVEPSFRGIKRELHCMWMTLDGEINEMMEMSSESGVLATSRPTAYCIRL